MNRRVCIRHVGDAWHLQRGRDRLERGVCDIVGAIKSKCQNALWNVLKMAILLRGTSRAKEARRKEFQIDLAPGIGHGHGHAPMTLAPHKMQTVRGDGASIAMREPRTHATLLRNPRATMQTVPSIARRKFEPALTVSFDCVRTMASLQSATPTSFLGRR